MALTKVNGQMLDGAITADSSGNVGIGTSSPDGKLTIETVNSNTPRIRFQNASFDGDAAISTFVSSTGTDLVLGSNLYINSAGNLARFDSAQAGSYVYAGRTGILYFGTNDTSGVATERMRIASNGVTTFSASGASDQAMYVNNTSNTSPYGIQCTFLGASPNNTTNTFFIGADSTNSKVIIYSSGTITNRTGTYNSFSDIKLKQDIVDSGSQWDDIKSVRVRKFRLKDDVVANPEAKPMIGVIAQELEQTSPGLIDDCIDKEGGVTKAVKYSILYMKAIKALQEAMERIETIEAKVEAQAAEIAALKVAK